MESYAIIYVALFCVVSGVAVLAYALALFIRTFPVIFSGIVTFCVTYWLMQAEHRNELIVPLIILSLFSMLMLHISIPKRQ